MEVGYPLKKLPLDLWRRDIFEVIGAHFDGLESIALDTLNLIRRIDARSQVWRNLSGFMPDTLELKNGIRGSLFLNFGNFEPLIVPNIVKNDLFISDFFNPIDLHRLESVALDEEMRFELPSSKWDFLKNHKPSISRNPFESLRVFDSEIGEGQSENFKLIGDSSNLELHDKGENITEATVVPNGCERESKSHYQTSV